MSQGSKVTAFILGVVFALVIRSIIRSSSLFGTDIIYDSKLITTTTIRGGGGGGMNMNEEKTTPSPILLSTKKEEQEQKDDLEDKIVGEEDEDEQENVADSFKNNKTIAKKPKKIRVCIATTNKRQASIFYSGRMAKLGSGMYSYAIKAPGQCSPSMPAVHMIPFVICCTSVTSVMQRIEEALAKNLYDIVIITGDEFCVIKDRRVHFRQYFGEDVIHKGISNTFNHSGVLKFPEFFPLGPRHEFKQVTKRDVILEAKQRRYLFNFLGSLTSPSRRILEGILDRIEQEWQKKYPGEAVPGHGRNISLLPRPVLENSSPLSKRSFVHITEKWHTQISASLGYVEPDDYRKVLLQSIFTLCPTGHNPEAYRIYEACEVGSIPILALDKFHNEHECKGAFKPFIEADAPFIFLKTWDELQGFLENVTVEFVQKQQQRLREWYANWINDQALKFEEVLEWRYSKRMKKMGISSPLSLP